MRVLAIIPARGGSKGVKRKNIRPLAGKPLIEYSIDIAKQSCVISDVIVSTDDVEIAEIAKNLEVKVLKRPDNLANDTASVYATVVHVLNELQDDYDVIILMQPTSPIRKVSDLDEIIKYFNEDEDLEGVISVVPMLDQHPARMYNLNENNFLSSFLEQSETARRQDLKPVYYRNGCYYAVRSEALKSQQTLMPNRKKAFIMDAKWLVNIDEERDFKIAEVIMEEWNKQ